ncbi:MAG: thiolase family protein [Betaproteobacteria bacterium]|nr:thiolase family protein [Betaproteobacteria bacterium]
MSTEPKVFVAGIGVLPFGKHVERSVTSLAVEAGLLALRDAGVAPREIGMGFFANVLASRLFGDSTLGQNVFASLGMNRIPVVNVENACTSGSSAFHLACMAIRAGECDLVLAIGAEKMCLPQMGLLSSGNTDPDTLLGLVTPASFALRARRHMQEFGTTAQQMAQVAVKNRKHAALNPQAQFREPITLEQVLNSPLIADPLTRLQSCPIADGAAAVLLCSEKVAKRLSCRIGVRASILVSGSYDNPQDLARWETDFRCAQQVYEKAGAGAADVDLVECHDAFTIAEIMHYEALGLCAPGEGGRFVESGAAALGGTTPVNVSGGLLSRGHPVAATGLAQIAEVTLQLREQAGARQVHGAKLGLAHCMGGDRAADTKSATIVILAT